MTIAEIISAINHKVPDNSFPVEKGSMLYSLGNGNTKWEHTQVGVTGAKVVIDKKEYTVKTGTRGEAGALVIASNAIYLGGVQVSPYMGVDEVTAIYAGTTLIYSSETGYYQVYYNGYKNGITWEANKLVRPQYTSYAGTSFDYANTGAGYILQYISDSAGEWSFNTHAITALDVTVPKRATKLHVYARAENSNAIELRFGLLPVNAPNSYSTANGGQLSSAFSISGTTWQDKTMTLSSDVKGKAYRVIVNAKGNGGVSRRMRTAWIWFD